MESKKAELLALISLLVVFFLYQVRIILAPFILAALISYLLNPLINRLVEHGMARIGAVVFVTTLSLTLVFFLLTVIIPWLIEEFELLTTKLPVYAQQLDELITLFNQRFEKFKLPSAINTVIRLAIKRGEELFLELINLTGELLINLLSRSLIFLITPVLIFYLLKDLEILQKKFWNLVSNDYSLELKVLLIKIDKVLIGFFRGQLIVSAFVGLTIAIGLYLLDIKFPLLLAIIAGGFNIIPYFGPFFGTIPALITAAFNSIYSVLAVLILFLVVQQIESSIVSPKVMGDKVGLHPIMILFSLLAGGELFGFIGLIIAIPLAAISKEVIKHLFKYHKRLLS